MLTIDSTGNENLRDELAGALGRKVDFSNGCWLDLNDDNGIFWGVTPYGVDWGCNSEEGWLDTVIKWLSFWNEDRDEQGNLLRP